MTGEPSSTEAPQSIGDDSRIEAISADIGSIFDTIDIPIVVVNRDYKVALFNRAATESLGLTASDVGQHSGNIHALSVVKDFDRLCEQVIADEAPCRRETRIGDRLFVVRFAPYARAKGEIEGAVLTFTNVTAFRASIEQAIYEREYTKSILNTVAEPLVVLDSDLQVQTANRAFYLMFDLSRERTQGLALCDLGDADWKTSSLWASLKAILLNNSELHSFEVERDFPTIGHRTILVDARRLSRDGSNSVLLAFRDVTEPKRAQAALQESERRFREMIDALPAAIYTTDAAGRLTHFNPECIELSGRVPQLGSDQWCVTWKLYHPDGTPMPHDECPMAIALKEGRIIRGTEAIAERPDGTRIWFMPYPTPLRDAAGCVVGGINMLVDITERKQAEDKLRTSELRFRTLFESMDEGYCVVEVIFDEHKNPTDYRFLETNPAFEKQTGIQDAKGRLMRQIAPDHEQHWFDIYGRIALTGETLRFENSAAALARYYDVCAFRIGDPELRRVGIVFNDITERKRAEEIIRQSQAALVEADRRKDEFLATLAHELRNPLAPIRNSLQILRLGYESSAETKRIHEMMERQVGHLVRLVDDLLELSRISRGQIELKKERVELVTIIRNAVDTSKPFIEAAGHRLVVSLPSEPLVVDGDLVRLSQVFANLLNNAAKYTENGGDIAVTARREEKFVVVSIRDTGIGIPPDKLTQVFEMFAQVDNVLRRSQDGLGIGLSLVRTLVGMHDGRVEAHSDGIGLGSEFVTYLPLAKRNHQSMENADAPNGYKQSAVSTHRVLLVDDNRDSADTLAMLLKHLGTEVKIAYDGRSALDALRIYRPSLLLLDIGMPGMDGYDVARQVRQIPEFCDLVLIALTGWGQEEDRRRTKEAGFDHHLVKPVEIGTLQSLLASLEDMGRHVKSAGQPANVALGPSS
jgi:PAS domain S-box-containing protein